SGARDPPGPHLHPRGERAAGGGRGPGPGSGDGDGVRPADRRRMAPPEPAPVIPRIALEDVWLRQASAEVLSGLSLEITEGEVLALLGPSAAGKTTALRMMLGLVAPGRGTVRLRGDVGLRGELLGLFAELLRERRATAVYVTHDPREAARLGDRIAVLERGRIVQVGTLDELHANPATAFVHAVLEELARGAGG